MDMIKVTLFHAFPRRERKANDALPINSRDRTRHCMIIMPRATSSQYEVNIDSSIETASNRMALEVTFRLRWRLLKRCRPARR